MEELTAGPADVVGGACEKRTAGGVGVVWVGSTGFGTRDGAGGGWVEGGGEDAVVEVEGDWRVYVDHFPAVGRGLSVLFVWKGFLFPVGRAYPSFERTMVPSLSWTLW